MSIVRQSIYMPNHRIGWMLGIGLLAAALSLLAPYRSTLYVAGLVSLVAADEVQTVAFVPRTAPEAVRRQTTPLFGMDTEPVISGDVVEKWTHAKTEIDRELNAVALCLVNDICSPAAQKLIDLSASGHFGTSGVTKRELAAELAGALALSAIRNADRVGLILFTSDVEHYVPPRLCARRSCRLARYRGRWIFPQRRGCPRWRACSARCAR